MSPVPCEVFPWRHGVPIGPRGPLIPAEAIMVVEIILPARSNIGMHGNDEVDVKSIETIIGRSNKEHKGEKKGWHIMVCLYIGRRKDLLIRTL